MQRTSVYCVRSIYLLVEAPTAPMRRAGMAAMKHPKEAANDRYLACLVVLHERTRWKYACHGIPPKVYKEKLASKLNKNNFWR